MDWVWVGWKSLCGAILWASLCDANNATKSMKRLKRPNSLFLQGEVSSAVLKTWKTRKTKTWITQNFQILYHIQGTTMWKSASSAFQKCGTFCVYDFLKGSYWLSKFSNISIFFDIQKQCHKKKTRPQFWFFGPETNSQGNSYGGPDLLFVSDPKTQNCGRVFFFDIAYFSGQTHFCCPVLTLSSNNSR